MIRKAGGLRGNERRNEQKKQARCFGAERRVGGYEDREEKTKRSATKRLRGGYKFWFRATVRISKFSFWGFSCARFSFFFPRLFHVSGFHILFHSSPQG